MNLTQNDSQRNGVFNTRGGSRGGPRFTRRGVLGFAVATPPVAALGPGLPIAATASPAHSIAATATWRQFHGDGRPAGLAAVVGPQALVQAWYVPAGADVDASPVVGIDGSVYFTVADGTVKAVRADGSEKWTSRWPAPAIPASPVLGADESVIFGDTHGRLWALSPDDGARRWTLEGLGSIRAPAAVAAGGCIYVGTENGELVAVDPAGAERFRLRGGGDIAGAPALADGGHVIWGGLDGTLQRVNGRGAAVWRLSLGGAIAGAGTDLVALVADTGHVRWRTALGAATTTTPGLGPDGTVYVGTEAGQLVAVGPDGAVRWRFRAGAAVRSSPVVGADGTVYFGASDAIVYAVGADGQRRPTFSTLDDVRGGASLAPDGTLYVGSRDNRLYALRDAARRFTESPPDRLGGTIVADPDSGRVFVLVSGTRRHIPDPETQHLLGLTVARPVPLTRSELARYLEAAPLPALREGGSMRGANGVTYRLQGGARRWLRDDSADASLSGGAAAVEDLVLRSLPLIVEGGMLLRGADGRVYAVEGRARRWVTSAGVFAARGYEWSAVHPASEATLTSLAERAPLV